MIDQYDFIWRRAVKRAKLPDIWLGYYEASDQQIREVISAFLYDVIGYIKEYGAEHDGTGWVDDYVRSMSQTVVPE